MKILIVIGVLFLSAHTSLQKTKYYTKSAQISFYSSTSLENIEAHNKAAVAVWDIASGQIDFSVLIKGFEFEKALMKEHFNENYLESDKYPKAGFKGKLNKAIALQTDGTQNLTATGELTIHGITKTITAPVIVSVKQGSLSATSVFTVVLEDYKIKVPSVVKNNINKEIQIKINAANFIAYN